MAVAFQSEFKHNDPDGVDEDPTMILSRARVEEAKSDHTGRVYRVYCDGVFDLFHLGHMRMLEQGKKALGEPIKTHLIAGVCSDELVNKFKGKTVMTHKLRCESVRHCKWVDEVLEDAPWVLTDEYLNKHKIDFVAHDAIPYTDTTGCASNSNDVYAHIKAKGMFLETQRTEGLSTSDIIVQIIKDYDDYVIRNLDRGYSKSELNVGKSWEVRKILHEKEKKIKQSVTNYKQQLDVSKEAWVSFIKEFNPRSSLFTSDEKKNLYFTPRNYVNKIKLNFEKHSHGVIHHTVGLCSAIAQTTLHFASYFNPLSYCEKKNRKKSE